MDTNTFRKYEISLGSSGDAVRIVKQLMHENQRVSYRTSGSSVFDANLRSAVSGFQRMAGLTNTSGNLDMESWVAMGESFARQAETSNGYCFRQKHSRLIERLIRRRQFESKC